MLACAKVTSSETQRVKDLERGVEPLCKVLQVAPSAFACLHAVSVRAI